MAGSDSEGEMGGMFDDGDWADKYQNEALLDAVREQRYHDAVEQRANSENAQFAKQEYWEERYKKDEGTFEWCKGYNDWSHLLREDIHAESKVLIVGCGNSEFSEQMYDAGMRHIINLDYSPAVIAHMSERCKERTEMQWMVGDIRAMTLPDASIDAIVDKGTMEALLVVEGPNTESDIARMCHEMSRVLKPGGVYIIMSFGQPHLRRPYLDRPEYGWTYQTPKTIGDAFHYYYYVMRKAP